jgi:hypothetical protein
MEGPDSPFSIVAGNVIHETIGSLDASEKIVLMIVLTSDGELQLQESTPAFMSLVFSFSTQFGPAKPLGTSD